MRFRPSTRAVSITIGYVVLLAALLVIRLGRQHLVPASPPADRPSAAVTPPSPAPPIEGRAKVDAPTVEAPKVEAPNAEAPKPVAAPKPLAVSKPLASKPVESPRQAEALEKTEPAAEVTAKPAPTSGDARATPDVARTDTAMLPPPTLPEALAEPGRIGEAMGPVAALPRTGAMTEMREITPRDRIYQRESSALAQVLGHYEQAYDRLDATRAAVIWPSVNERALSRAFARLQTQDLDFGNCTFAVSTSDAAARCAGVLRYARRIGDTALKTEQHVWTIEFARAGETWQIVKISAQ